MIMQLPIPAQMFVRDQGSGKIMLLCVVPTDCIPENLRTGTFMGGHIMIHATEAFDGVESVKGLRADQILRRGWDTSQMTEIEL